jgi:hypothetical protein
VSRLPLTDRPHAVLVDLTISAGNLVITAPYAVLFLAAEERGEEETQAEPARAPLAKCLPRNVIALPARRVG